MVQDRKRLVYKSSPDSEELLLLIQSYMLFMRRQWAAQCVDRLRENMLVGEQEGARDGVRKKLTPTGAETQNV
jgi:hypothetical protein